VQGLYEGYEQTEVQAIRPISSKGDGRGAISELLITNGYRKVQSGRFAPR